MDGARPARAHQGSSEEKSEAAKCGGDGAVGFCGGGVAWPGITACSITGWALLPSSVTISNFHYTLNHVYTRVKKKNVYTLDLLHGLVLILRVGCNRAAINSDHLDAM
jgi:hypothetical protein